MFEMRIGFSFIGTLIFMLPMVINIVYFLSAHNKPLEPIGNSFNYTELIEKGTRLLYALSICLLTSKRLIDFQSPLLLPAGVSLLLYYAVWIRYFYKGRADSYLYKDFLKIPIPLAVFPVVYYFFGALLIHNGLAAGIIVIFGLAHFKVSLETKNNLTP